MRLVRRPAVQVFIVVRHRAFALTPRLHLVFDIEGVGGSHILTGGGVNVPSPSGGIGEN